jgi:hypothetical protein
MPLPLSTEGRAALRGGTVFQAWLIELSCLGVTLRGWNQLTAMTFEGQTWEALGGQFEIVGEIAGGVDLQTEPFGVSFDGGRQHDNASFIGRLLDATWHQRAIRVRQLIMQPGTNFVTAVATALDVRGRMQTIEAAEGETGPSTVQLSCESGTFAVFGRALTVLSDADQRLRDPDDTSMRDIATKPFEDIPYGVSYAALPGTAVTGGRGINGGNENTREE